MHFIYNQYVKTSLLFPMFILGLGILGFVPLLVQAIQAFFRKEIRWKGIIRLLTGLITPVLFISIGTGRLMHGGVYLAFEKEGDKAQVQGRIEQIEELGVFAFPKLDSEYSVGHTHGVRFTIDGVQYTAIEKGLLSVGDYVTVEYLPKSRYILYICEVPREENS